MKTKKLICLIDVDERYPDYSVEVFDEKRLRSSCATRVEMSLRELHYAMRVVAAYNKLQKKLKMMAEDNHV